MTTLRHTLTVCMGLISAFAAIAVPASAQSPRTISYQGLLNDTSGEPVPDASRTMTFKIYNIDSGGSALWTESKSVATVNGVFNTILGSDTPISGVDFDQDLWLGTTVAADGEMPRTKLAGVPYALGLATPYEDSIRIQTADLSGDGSERLNEDLTIYANDAMLGLYSNDGGGAGSGIQMGELVGGALTDKWTLFRRTSGAGSSFRLSYGSSSNYASNPTVVEIDTTGDILAGSLHYRDPGVPRYVSVPAFAFKPDGDFPAAEYTAMNFQVWIDAGATQLLAPIRLPDNAVLDSLYCWITDNDSDQNLGCSVGLTVAQPDGSVASSGTAPFYSSGTPGAEKIGDSLLHLSVDNSRTVYYIRVNPDSGDWSTAGSNLKLHMAVLKYHALEPL